MMMLGGGKKNVGREKSEEKSEEKEERKTIFRGLFDTYQIKANKEEANRGKKCENKAIS